MFKSIRHGLFAALAGFTVLICVAYTGLALVISYVTEDMLVDRLLEREAAAVSAQFRATGELGARTTDLVQVYRDQATLPPLVRHAVASGRLRAEIATDSGQHYHLRTLDLTTSNGPQRFYLLADVGAVLVVARLFQEVGGLLVAVALGLIALALALAYWLSRRLVAPLQILAGEVRAATPGVPLRLSARNRRDEIGYLAERLDNTISELHAALQREHAFTRDIGHELRTPLTVMNNTLNRPASTPLQVQELVQLRTGVDEMRRTVELLFALARAEHIAGEVFDLRGCIEERLLWLLEHGQHSNGNRPLELELSDLPEQLPVIGNRHLCTLLVNNCLDNAWFHGDGSAALRLSYADGVLNLINPVDPARAQRMQGFLHGQQLLQRIAAAMQWQIAFHAGPSAYRVAITPVMAPTAAPAH